MKLSERVALFCLSTCLTLAWAAQAKAEGNATNQAADVQAQSKETAQDEQAINEILRLGGMYWNTQRGDYLPKRTPNPTGREQHVVVSNTPADTAQPPLIRAYFTKETTDDSLRFFANLSQLEFIYLDRSRITDAGLSHLKNLPKVYNISLENTQIGDAGLANLAILSQLEILSLQDTKITDAGLKLLSKQPKIQRLFLDNTAITDTGLMYLTDLPNLTMLSLDGTKITEEGKKAFLNKKSDVNIRSLPRRNGLTTLRHNATRALPELIAPEKLLYKKLLIKRVSNGETLPENGGYTYIPDGKSHSMLLELKSLDLSEATELRFEVKKDETYGSIKITLRDWGNLMSDSIDITEFIRGEHDGFNIARIPIEAFKANGWDMQSVKLIFIGDQNKKDKGGPSFSVRSIEAGFKKQGD